MTDNKELNNRFDQLEQRLNALTADYPGSAFYNLSAKARPDEIDIRALWSVLWRGKWTILVAGLLSSVLGAVVALNVPDRYESEGVYALSAKEASLGGLVGQYSGLAAMAGLDLSSGENNDVDQALELVDSWPFLEKIIQIYDLKPLIAGVKTWDRKSNSIVWDADQYNFESKEWIRKPPPGKLAEPSSFEVFQALKGMIKVDYSKSVGLVRVSVEHYSPIVAKEWVVLIVKELDKHFQQRDVSMSENAIKYLQEKIDETGLSEMKSVLYEMVESQTKTLMLANISSGYLLKEVVPPKIAEEKSRPARVSYVLFAGFLGCLLGILFFGFRWLRVQL